MPNILLVLKSWTTTEIALNMTEQFENLFNLQTNNKLNGNSGMQKMDKICNDDNIETLLMSLTNR